MNTIARVMLGTLMVGIASTGCAAQDPDEEESIAEVQVTTQAMGSCWVKLHGCKGANVYCSSTGDCTDAQAMAACRSLVSETCGFEVAGVAEDVQQ